MNHNFARSILDGVFTGAVGFALFQVFFWAGARHQRFTSLPLYRQKRIVLGCNVVCLVTSVVYAVLSALAHFLFL